MVTFWVTLASFIGSSFAAAWLTERFKRRDRRAALVSDLDVYAKLPNGDLKERVLHRIEQQIELEWATPNYLVKPRFAKFFRGLAATYFLLALIPVGYIVLLFCSGEIRVEHHSDDGLNWVHDINLESYTLVNDYIMHQGLAAVVMLGVPLLLWISTNRDIRRHELSQRFAGNSAQLNQNLDQANDHSDPAPAPAPMPAPAAD